MVLKKLSKLGKKIINKKDTTSSVNTAATKRATKGRAASPQDEAVEVYEPGKSSGKKPPQEKAAPKPASEEKKSESKSDSSEGSKDDSQKRRRRRPQNRNKSNEGDKSSSDSDQGKDREASDSKPSRGGDSRRKGQRSSGRGRNDGGRSRGNSSGRNGSGRSSSSQRGGQLVNIEATAAAEHGDWDPSSFDVPEKEGSTRFPDLNLPPEVLHALADLGFKYCTPIQAGTLPTTLDGKDAAGKAQTGTGKTAAFLLTIFSHLIRNPIEGERRTGTPRVLVLGPTRELVLQIEKEAQDMGKYVPAFIMPVFGGMDFEKQKEELLKHPSDVLVATPGRLIDFMRRNVIDLSQVEILVIDEADRMLDMGFIPDVKQIVYSTPPKQKRQTLLFSATLTSDVVRLAESWTTEQNLVEIEPEQVTVDTVDQLIYITTAEEKFKLLYNILQKAEGKPVMVFGNRRDITQGLFDLLKGYGFKTELLSGAVNQTKRLKVLEKFKAGEINVLVATDVAGRGIHVDNVAYVINYNLPQDAEDYVHRIGRTGRAGALGTSISFACEEESFAIPAIEEYIKIDLKCAYPDEELLAEPPPAPELPKREKRERQDHRRHQRGGRRGDGPSHQGRTRRHSGSRRTQGGGSGRRSQSR